MNVFAKPPASPLLIATAMGLAGCSMIPDYQRPASPVAARFPGAGNHAGQAAEIGWRDFFADNRLKRLIELALANNCDYQVAVLNVEQSRAQYRITRAAEVPAVQGSGGYSRTGEAGRVASQWNASVGSTAYEVDLFGRVRSLNKQALETYFATEEARRGAQISLVAEIATTYFTLRQAEEQIALAQRTLKAVEDTCGLTRAMVSAGASSELDLRTAEGQVQTAKINLLTYERDRAQAVNALALLVGQPMSARLPAPGAFDSARLLAAVPAGLPSELIQRRPDILEAEHGLKAANANIGAARAAFFPTITLTGSLGSGSSQLSQLFGSNSGNWTFSPQVTVPIFDGGRNQATLDSAKVAARIEVVKYKKAIESAFREVSDALVNTSSYARQIEEEITLIQTQQSRYDLANLRYRQGEDSYINVLSAQQNLYSAQQELLQARFRKLSSQIALYKALGGGWK